jgi:sporulation protein YlmC with PRC-barrel domain
MELKPDAGVFTSKGKAVGQVDRVVIDPKTKNVSHIVVRKGLIQTESRVLAEDGEPVGKEVLEQVPDHRETDIPGGYV